MGNKISTTGYTKTNSSKICVNEKFSSSEIGNVFVCVSEDQRPPIQYSRRAFNKGRPQRDKCIAPRPTTTTGRQLRQCERLDASVVRLRRSSSRPTVDAARQYNLAVGGERERAKVGKCVVKNGKVVCFRMPKRVCVF